MERGRGGVTAQVDACLLARTGRSGQHENPSEIALIERDSIRDRDEQLSAIPMAPTRMQLSNEVTPRDPNFPLVSGLA